MYFTITPSDSDVQHYGIKGMKWGVRRYQNEDGTLTELGKRRVKTDGSEGDTYDKVHAEVAKDYGRISSAQNSAANAARSASNIANRSANAERAKAKSDIDVSEMSDEELRARINRMNLERQYKDLSTETVGTGKRVLSDILQTTGDVLAIGASAAGILLAIHQLKSGSGK